MPTDSEHVVFHRKELAGSRLRCLMATSLPDEQVRQFLNDLIGGHAVVEPGHSWMPRGLLDPDEAMLGVTDRFLAENERKAVLDWWLAVSRNPVTPNWDLASECDVNGKPGLLLVEAKAHAKELKPVDRCGATSRKNYDKIAAAVGAANDGLNLILPGWNLSHETHFQLCNRFAWAWKLAMLGRHIVLVYLGFLNADEMGHRGEPFRSSEAWSECVRAYAEGVVPASIWSKRIAIGSGSVLPLIRSASFSVNSDTAEKDVQR